MENTAWLSEEIIMCLPIFIAQNNVMLALEIVVICAKFNACGTYHFLTFWLIGNSHTHLQSSKCKSGEFPRPPKQARRLQQSATAEETNIMLLIKHNLRMNCIRLRYIIAWLSIRLEVLTTATVIASSCTPYNFAHMRWQPICVCGVAE